MVDCNILSIWSRFSIVLLSRADVADKFMDQVVQYCPDAQIIFDTVDLHYLREERQAKIESSRLLAASSRSRKKQEIALMKKADSVLVVSPVEQEAILAEFPSIPVEVVSNIHEIFEPVSEYGGRSGLLFIGSFNHPPNVDAIRYFVHEIFPLVRAEIPGITLNVVGSNLGDKLDDCDVGGVILQGFVADLTECFSSARLSIAPLRYGAGVKGKVNMSMCHGVPVVGTPIAAEGMWLEDGRDILIADSAEEYVRKIVLAYTDPEIWSRLSEGGYRNIESHFSIAAASSAIHRVVTGTPETHQARA